MKPDFDAGLNYVNASYQSIHGLIKSNWKKNKNVLEWEITIPTNTSALVYLPTSQASEVKVNNQKLDNLAMTYNKANGFIILTVPSGNYSIKVK